MLKRLILLAAGLPGLLPAQDPSIFGIFVGSTPAGEPIRQLLRLPAGPKAELMEWTLVLRQDPKTQAPARYDLRCQYGMAAAGKPGLAAGAQLFQRTGEWKQETAVLDLGEGIRLRQVDRNIVHVQDAAGGLMPGDSGGSYTLNRAESAEKPVDPALAQAQPERSYELAPLAVGPRVLAVLEGRTPCQGIARQLRIPVDPGCTKAKWRVTLYQNPVTKAPAAYRVEGSLFGRRPRTGNWLLRRGIPGDPGATVYELAPAGGEPPVRLLRGDDSVVFFLDGEGRPLTGNAEFSYTLNRRSGAP